MCKTGLQTKTNALANTRSTAWKHFEDEGVVCDRCEANATAAAAAVRQQQLSLPAPFQRDCTAAADAEAAAQW